MALPHQVQMQLIKKQLLGKEGKAKLEEIEKITRQLPGYNTGPYGEIKKWLKEEARKTKVRSKIKHQDWLGVKKQGIRQFVLVGCPSVGKSSLIKELSGLQTKIADYEFTTLKPLPAIVNINNAEFQIVDLPGLVEGAADNAGNGKRFIGIVRTADGILLMHDLTKPVEMVESVVQELRKAEIQKPMIVIGSKVDVDGARQNLDRLKQKYPNLPVVALSNTTGEGLERLKSELWKQSRLIRVYPVHENHPVIMDKDATVKEFTEKIHRELVKKFRFAKVTGTSTKFPNQQVGLSHVLEDGDRIELVLRN